MLLGVTPVGARSALAPFAMRATTVGRLPVIDGSIDSPAWRSASGAQLAWNLTYRRAAENPTRVYLLADARFLYVAFVVHQRERITATQHTDDQGVSTDDAVNVYLWPGGVNGFEYSFSVNPNGAHSATSSENTAFSPKWRSAARVTHDGYVVTERIPLDVMRGDGRDVWLVQFGREVQTARVSDEWAHATAQTSVDDPRFAGRLSGMAVAARATRAKPRLQLYSLSDIGGRADGGSTSRMGADFSIPVARTVSLFGTLHPDYSDVELDQQTISPTVFPRQYQEVRPFFTQSASFYNAFDCHDCVDFPPLYTPAIPTPRDGFALEGVDGRVGFAAFDAISAGRSDTAQSLGWTSSDQHYRLQLQRQSADFAGVHDVALYGQAGYGNLHNFNTYATFGRETGTQIAQPGGGDYAEYGAVLYTPTSALRLAYHDVGGQYNPVDGYVSLNDVRGPSLSAYRRFDFGPHSFLQNIRFDGDLQRFRTHAGVRNYTVDSSQLTFNARNQLSLSISSGDNYVLQPGLPSGEANQNGITLTYLGDTATPDSISYSIGRFGGGYLRAWSRLLTLQVARRFTLAMEADNTADALDNGGTLTQWLERGSLAYQIDRSSSFALGLRRIIGTPPTFFDVPSAVDAANLSLAYYRRFGNAEIYAVYGDPNALATQHAFIVKLVEYVGAQKGT